MNTPVTRVGGQGVIPTKTLVDPKVKSGDGSFSQVLEKFVDDVNSLQNRADQSIEKLHAGEIKDVGEVMMAVEEASIAMEFMLEIRNKIIEAYQEVMRMPV